MAVFRPLTPDHKVDIERMSADAPQKSLAEYLPPLPAGAAPADPALARPRASSRAQLAGLLIAVLAVLLVVVFISQSLPAPAPRAAAPAAPSVAPAGATAPATPAAAQPAAAAAAQLLPRPVGAFAAPDGAYLGIVEAGRAYTPTARLGDAWTQIAAQGSGLVWVQAAELAPDLSLADLATPTARPQPTALPAPAVQVREVPVPAAPQPTQCATVSGGGTSVQRCGSAPIGQLEADARAAWRAQFGGNAAPIATMTPYGGKP